MLNVFKIGFLQTRGDLLSDILILAVAIITPLMFIAVYKGRVKSLKIHHNIMLTIYYIVIAYVILYEGNMLLHGGLEFLRAKIKMNEVFYFTFTGFHIIVGAFALIIGAFTIKYGKIAKENYQIYENRRVHRVYGWWEVCLLSLTSITGIILYYLTFVFTQ